MESIRSRVAISAALTALVICAAACTSTPPDAARAPASHSTGPSARPATTGAASSPDARAGALRHPAHIVIVVEENHSFDELTDAQAAPYLATLAGRAAVLTGSFAVTHPSEPNYLALFSGSTQGMSDDSCPRSFGGPNLGRALLDASLTFAGYSEDLPSVGSGACSAGSYARKHNPWADFTNLPPSVNQPLSALPSDYSQLPVVSFVIPNEANDMHSGSVSAGDRWLADHLGGYAAWAAAHDSLLVITCDEDDHSASNRVLTMLVGAHVRAGTYPERVDHYSLLRLVEDAYGLPRLGQSAEATPIDGMWTG
ncbi:MAG TPA: alkaline phosphatase family protein [Jatrophihabitantaceae bacterium]|jgi:acid phosphatase|nr:alkaline phosphatase family protein [Jatrophihabitantaceae bacterium]